MLDQQIPKYWLLATIIAYHVAFTGKKALTAQVEGNETTRARCVERYTGANQIEEPGYAVSQQRVAGTSRLILHVQLWVGVEIGQVVVIEPRHEYAGIRFVDI